LYKNSLKTLSGIPPYFFIWFLKILRTYFSLWTARVRILHLSGYLLFW